MKNTRERKPTVRPSMVDAEDRFISEGGSLGPYDGGSCDRRGPSSAPGRLSDLTQRATAAPAANEPSPLQLQLMSVMDVDFLNGAYQHSQQRFLRLEDALNRAELLRRFNRKGGA
ncbi:hypothetical protein OOT46_13700 [Aquabacterium sp. A7-Y]|uniref:hypothetical protein n=1 Tax=Aquabacterium sp. A7-Y TaxID=1349605 RepID=UPI00223D6833|nr:hypothetical protein [Aquabacterium sp. A7-Y]MCW7538895.1 hypothetical protein [Aquabacterium sp. A7-Y]